MRTILLLSALILAGCAHAASAPDFTLRADSGNAWNLSAQRGKTVLLTFGFTHCADTCPATLAKLAHLTQRLGSRGSRSVIAFVTVDPKRDTPHALHVYLQRFRPESGSPIVGLTGTQPQIDAVEQAYHVWAQRIPGRHGRPNEYDEAHSAVIYFIDGNGRIRSLHDDDDADAVLAHALAEAMT